MRGKSRRKRKQKLKRIKRKAMGKLVRFSLANSPKKYNGFKNKYSYGTNIHNLIYKGGNFENVRFQASNITRCNFKNTRLIGIEFMNSNLKGTKFNGAILKDVIFFNCNLKETDFTDVKFNNVKFISTNINKSVNLNENDGIEIMRSYPNIKLDYYLKKSILRLQSLNKIYNYHILHVKKDKINLWSIDLLLRYYNQHDLSRALVALVRRKDKRGFFTIYKYREFIDSYLKIC